MNVRRHPRIAECADQDGVEVALQHGKAFRRNGDAIGEVTLGAPVKMRHLNRRVRGGDNLHRFRNDFPANAVSGNNGDAFFLTHGRKVPQVKEKRGEALVHPGAYAGYSYSSSSL